MAVSPILFTGDLVLFLLLRFDKSFDYNSEIILEENVTEKILSMFLLPLGCLVVVANLMYRQRLSPWISHNKSNTGNEERDTPRLKRNLKALIQPASFIALFLGALVLSGIMIDSVLNGKGIYSGFTVSFILISINKMNSTNTRLVFTKLFFSKRSSKEKCTFRL